MQKIGKKEKVQGMSELEYFLTITIIVFIGRSILKFRK